jgi:hypothetical protein
MESSNRYGEVKECSKYTVEGVYGGCVWVCYIEICGAEMCGAEGWSGCAAYRIAAWECGVVTRFAHKRRSTTTAYFMGPFYCSQQGVEKIVCRRRLLLLGDGTKPETASVL